MCNNIVEEDIISWVNSGVDGHIVQTGFFVRIDNPPICNYKSRCYEMFKRLKES